MLYDRIWSGIGGTIRDGRARLSGEFLVADATTGNRERGDCKRYEKAAQAGRRCFLEGLDQL